MKQINVISDFYRNMTINFNGFIVKFNSEGKSILEFEEKDEASVEKIFEMHPNIYKGDKLPIKEKVEAPVNVNRKETVAEVVVELEHLKQSNKDLALENASLKKENETLKREKEELENKICTLMQANKVEKPADEKEITEETKNFEEVEKFEENAGGKEEEEKEEISLKEDLNKKTVSQLKELLNTDDFLPFKEEWKSLIKKDEIINYILKKVEEEEK